MTYWPSSKASSIDGGRLRTVGLCVLLGLVCFLSSNNRAEARAPAGSDIDIEVQLTSADPSARRSAAHRIVELGPRLSLPNSAKVVEALVQAIVKENEPDILDTEISALAAIGAPALPTLIRLINNNSSAVRVSLIRAIGKMGPVAASAVPALSQVALDNHSNFEARIAATIALGAVGSTAPDSVSTTLTRLLKDSDATVRFEAACALADLAGNGASAAGDDTVVPSLVSSLQDPDPNVRQAGALALGRSGRHAAQALSFLVLSLGDFNPYVRVTAAKSLFQE